MKKIILISVFILGFSEEKTATIKFTQKQYDAIEATLKRAMLIMDSVKIGLKYVSNGDKMSEDLLKAQRNILAVEGFISQIDTVFYPKKEK